MTVALRSANRIQSHLLKAIDEPDTERLLGKREGEGGREKIVDSNGGDSRDRGLKILFKLQSLMDTSIQRHDPIRPTHPFETSRSTIYSTFRNVSDIFF